MGPAAKPGYPQGSGYEECVLKFLSLPGQGPFFYFELLSSPFFSGASATFVLGGSAAFFPASFGRLKKALILSSIVITHLT